MSSPFDGGGGKNKTVVGIDAWEGAEDQWEKNFTKVSEADATKSNCPMVKMCAKNETVVGIDAREGAEAKWEQEIGDATKGDQSDERLGLGTTDGAGPEQAAKPPQRLAALPRHFRKSVPETEDEKAARKQKVTQSCTS